jgi:hypothetical protein
LEESLARNERLRQTEIDKKKWPTLFDWAESAAAKIGATAADVCGASRATTSVAVTILVPIWLTILLSVTSDSPLLQVLMPANVVALVSFTLAWGVRALRSRIHRKGLTIFLQSVAFAGAVLALGLVVKSAWTFQSEIISAWAEAAAKKKVEQEAVLEAQKMLDEARKSELEGARLAEAKCQKNRNDAIERAKLVRRSARKAFDVCKANFDKLVLTFKSIEVHCNVQIAQLDSAKDQLGAANSRTCSTGSVKK